MSLSYGGTGVALDASDIWLGAYGVHWETFFGRSEQGSRSEISCDEQENVKSILRSIQGVVTSRNIHKLRKRERNGRGGRVRGSGTVTCRTPRLKHCPINIRQPCGERLQRTTYVVLSFEGKLTKVGMGENRYEANTIILRVEQGSMLGHHQFERELRR